MPGYSNEILDSDASLDVGGFKDYLKKQLGIDVDSRATAEELLKMDFLAKFPPQ